MQEFDVHFLGKAHQAHSLVFYLCNQSLVLVVLGSNEFSDEVFTVGFCDSFRLGIKNISQIIVIFLFGWSHLNKGEHVNTRREKDLGFSMDASDVRHDAGVNKLALLEVMSQGSEAMRNILDICIAA